MSFSQGRNGGIYGTTSFGGANGAGTVFKIAPGGRLTTLHSFAGADGASVNAGLVLARDGNFYGTTGAGGAHLNGTVFKITPSGNLSTLHSFVGFPTDGSQSFARLLQALDGNLYGTTAFGGANNSDLCFGMGCGTIFKITPAGVFTMLYSFCSQPNCDDGVAPYAGLVQGTDGNFYGITSGSGVKGTVFKITGSGQLTTLHSFIFTDGSNPYGTLVQGLDGNFYGTTGSGGSSSNCRDGCGTVFTITSSGQLTSLHSFDVTDGAFPYAGLVQGTDGNFYGATEQGGANLNCPFLTEGCGTLFEITPNGTLATLHSFDGSDGDAIDPGLLQATDGNFYGATSYGGRRTNCQQGCGTIFSLSTGLGPFVTFVTATGKVGQSGGILGQGFTGTTSVMLNGSPARFTVKSDTFILATVPAGATTGYVTVTTPSGTLTSNVPFHVIP
jgi:uncharacterized repeat protein (TIGR03803 family)